MPESKRATKVKDTAYSFQKVADLMVAKKRLEEQLGIGAKKEEDSSNKRYEDKTQEEIREELVKKR